MTPCDSILIGQNTFFGNTSTDSNILTLIEKKVVQMWELLHIPICVQIVSLAAELFIVPGQI